MALQPLQGSHWDSWRVAGPGGSFISQYLTVLPHSGTTMPLGDHRTAAMRDKIVGIVDVIYRVYRVFVGFAWM